MTKTDSLYQAPKAPAQLPLDVPWALLGQRSPTVFMRDYWHKRPLLIRNAIPSFALAKAQGRALQSPVSAKVLFNYASDGHSEARLVKSKPWQLEHGPFRKGQIPALQSHDWTLLVQGVEARHPAAANVLSWFRFIPDARLDDLMISIAGVGGGVGPHVDSYDVFLIQMEGRRRWKISTQSDLSLRDDLPLKILSRFKAKEDWVLEPGDLLYLPPHIAHEGVALDAGCQTWSVGFRSPSYRELLQEGLWRLAESLEDDPRLSARYADPLQDASKDPAVLPKLLEKQITKYLRKLALDQGKQWLPGIGAYLSEPKPQAIFEGPPVMMTPKAFWQSLHSKTLVPHPQTRLLIWGNEVFCNGEAVSRQEPPFVQKGWLELARVHSLCLGTKNSRRNKVLVSPSPEKWIPQASSLYEAYCSGWLIWA